jgi:hypothetical protein
VLGVEPDARMAAFARGSGVEVEVATFEAWDAAGRAFDAVVAGTAWHWVDPVAGAAKAARGGSFTMGYTTVVVTAARTGDQRHKESAMHARSRGQGRSLRTSTSLTG